MNNLAVDKATAYREMYRVLKPGRKLSFSDVVSYAPIPHLLRKNQQAWADCVAGVLSFQELQQLLAGSGFHGVRLVTDYLWREGSEIIERYFSGQHLSAVHRRSLEQVKLYSVTVDAFKPVVDPGGECYFLGQHALFHGPGAAFHLDDDPDHVFTAGEMKEVCEKTATILNRSPLRAISPCSSRPATFSLDSASPTSVARSDLFVGAGLVPACLASDHQSRPYCVLNPFS